METKEKSVGDSMLLYSRMNGWFTMSAFNESIGLERGDPAGYTVAGRFLSDGVLSLKRARVGGVGSLINHYRYKSELQQKPLPMTRTSNVPALKRRVSIKKSWIDKQLIDFYTDSDIAVEFSEFGEINSLNGSLYRLSVDGRYDFQEVLDFVAEYDLRNL